MYMYIVTVAKGRNYSLIVDVKTLSEAAKVCRNFIKEHNLGSSRYTGGEVYDLNKNMIAKVSYNGRVWDMDGIEIRVDDAPLAEEISPVTGERHRFPPKNVPFPTTFHYYISYYGEN